MKKYILGCGINGLIFKYYNPEYSIIGEEVDGLLKNEFMKNTILLHDTQETEKMLKDLGIDIKKKTHLIKYIKNNTILKEISLLDKVSFIRKKLMDDNIQVEDVTLSTNDYYISILDIDLDEVLKKLKQNISILQEKIIRITDSEIITENNRYEYDEIVSTLPANVFWNLYYKKTNVELKYLPSTYVITDEIPEVLVGEKWDLAYFIDTKKKYTRINKRENKYLYEFTGKLNEEEIKKLIPSQSNIRESFVKDVGIIISNKNNIPPDRIRFLGRFAKWEHSNKIQDTVKEANWSYDFKNIWNKQKSFSSKLIDYNTIDNKKKEEYTQLFILHLLEELGEILRELNYKQHKVNKKVNRDKILEECIDTFKYLLNILLIWNVDVKEFVEFFNNKSNIVERRLEDEKNTL